MEVGGQHLAPAALPLGNTQYPLYMRLGGNQAQPGRVQKIFPPPNRIQSPVCQTVVSHYTTYAIPAHSYVVLNTKKMINSNNINNMKIMAIKIFMLFMPSNSIN
jgi:hypothetical protein